VRNANYGAGKWRDTPGNFESILVLSAGWLHSKNPTVPHISRSTNANAAAHLE
jgi:hypothetical protein